MANRLAGETSPYLVQHAGNPVDWYPWGPEALARAREEDRPILLSIGYAACHWCHVMAHESFEDAATASLMNERFVNIKVDREERPDLDSIYMQAVQALTGHGGWPMTVFLTPDGAPFYGGTYFPPEDRHGMPSFRRVLTAAADAYRTRRDEVTTAAKDIAERLYAGASAPTRSAGPLTRELLERAWRSLAVAYEPRHGGFGGAPKFPQPMVLEALLRHWARTGTEAALDIVRHTWRAMSHGGMYDQLGGGFARYSVDDQWLVPHFEKMLYDNALLARLGVHLWQVTGDTGAERVARETLDWALREMRAPEVGFCSSLDADSEGHEGKFYIWSAAEIDELLGDDAPVARSWWGVTPEGNFEGENILTRPDDERVVAARMRRPAAEIEQVIERARGTLMAARDRRVRPGRDDKVVAAWNGLMIVALADAARAFDDARYRDEAIRTGEAVFSQLVRDGRVLRSTLGGEARVAGFLEDHAALGLAALALYELTFDRTWLDQARLLADACVTWFWDDTAGAFYDTASDHETLIARPRDATDNATPAGTSLAADLLARLGELLHDVDYVRRANWVCETLADAAARYPLAFGWLLGPVDMLVHGAVELALVGPPDDGGFRSLAQAAAEVYVPSLVLAGGPPDDTSPIALLEGHGLVSGRPAAYVCRRYTCDAPTADPGELKEQLSRASSSRAAEPHASGSEDLPHHL